MQGTYIKAAVYPLLASQTNLNKVYPLISLSTCIKECVGLCKNLLTAAGKKKIYFKTICCRNSFHLIKFCSTRLVVNTPNPAEPSLLHEVCWQFWWCSDFCFSTAFGIFNFYQVIQCIFFNLPWTIQVSAPDVQTPWQRRIWNELSLLQLSARVL